MFDNPKRELERMEQELRKEASDEDILEDWLDRVITEEQQSLPLPRAQRKETPVLPANDFEGTVFAVPQPRKKGIGGLVLLAILEMAAIGALVGWWLQWL